MTKLSGWRLLKDRKEETMKTRVDLDNVKSMIFIAALLTLFVGNSQFALAQSDSGWKQKWDTTLGQA